MKRILIGTLSLSFALLANSTQCTQKITDSQKDLNDYKAFFSLAKSGDIDSQALLGEMLLKGEGVDMDLDKAFYWLSKASSQNDAQSLYHLGFMYENGIRVGINVQRAVALYKKAAQKGDILAEYSLAMIYKTGKGDIKRDVNQYKKWLTRVKNSKQALAYQASAQ